MLLFSWCLLIPVMEFDSCLIICKYLKVCQFFSHFNIMPLIAPSETANFILSSWSLLCSVDHTAKKEDFPAPQIPGF